MLSFKHHFNHFSYHRNQHHLQQHQHPSQLNKNPRRSATEREQQKEEEEQEEREIYEQFDRILSEEVDQISSEMQRRRPARHAGAWTGSQSTPSHSEYGGSLLGDASAAATVTMATHDSVDTLSLQLGQLDTASGSTTVALQSLADDDDDESSAARMNRSRFCIDGDQGL